MRLSRTFYRDKESRILGFDVNQLSGTELKKELAAHKEALVKCQKSKGRCKPKRKAKVKGSQPEKVGNTLPKESKINAVTKAAEKPSFLDKNGKWLLVGSIGVLAYAAYKNSSGTGLNQGPIPQPLRQAEYMVNPSEMEL